MISWSVLDAVPFRAVGKRVGGWVCWSRLVDGEDAQLLLSVRHVLTLKEAIDAVDFKLEAPELLVHLGMLRLHLNAEHL
jgi:hypothetical protein